MGAPNTLDDNTLDGLLLEDYEIPAEEEQVTVKNTEQKEDA